MSKYFYSIIFLLPFLLVFSDQDILETDTHVYIAIGVYEV